MKTKHTTTSWAALAAMTIALAMTSCEEGRIERRPITDEQKSNAAMYAAQLMAGYPANVAGDDPDYATAIAQAHRAAMDLYGQPILIITKFNGEIVRVVEPEQATKPSK